MADHNLVKCKNEVFIEGESIGRFASFSMEASRESLGATAVLTLPLYGIGITADNWLKPSIGVTSKGSAKRRVRAYIQYDKIKVCAHVEVYCWYEGFEKIKVFDGFIEQISEGFPATLRLRDATFMLRFGTNKKAFNHKATLSQILTKCVKIAQDAFKATREELGFKNNDFNLNFSEASKKVVQAKTGALSLANFASGRSPFDILQYLQQSLSLYAGVYKEDGEYKVFAGTGVRDTSRDVIKLDTRVNVIGRNIVQRDSRFVHYDVKVKGILSNGSIHTASASTPLTQTGGVKEKGIPVYRFSPTLRTVAGLNNFAKELQNSLNGTRNSGTIALLMYPKCEVLDTVDYTDTIFNINSARYYVLKYIFTANSKGYFQQLDVTDEVFRY